MYGRCTVDVRQIYRTSTVHLPYITVHSRTSTVHYRTFPYIYRTLPYIYRTLPYIYCTYSLLFIRVHRVFGAPATTFWTDHRHQNFWTDHRHQLFWTDHLLQFFGRTTAFNFLDGPPPSVFLTHRCRSLCVLCFLMRFDCLK